MTTLRFLDPNPPQADITALIVGVLGENRPITVEYNQDLGKLFAVDLPDATQAEADAVRAALVAAFPTLVA